MNDDNDFPMTPREIVHELDKHIVGQAAAKRAVAIALRDRWRRARVPLPMRNEIAPKNILMIGPTGVGKTEIARRLARLTQAPFIKVEATKFTEVGYVGRDVDSIMRDLMEVAIKAQREKAMQLARNRAQDAAEDRILDVLVPPARDHHAGGEDSATRQKFRKMLREGQLDDREIEIELGTGTPVQPQIFAPQGMEDFTSQIQEMFQNVAQRVRKPRKVRIADAMQQLTEEESASLVDEDDIRQRALQQVEQNGIVFIDEIDKIASRGQQGSSNGEVSRQGVQRDLLPLVEGTTVNTKYGLVRTDHVLFIASGAFHLSRPSDLIPELQGRFPIRVELESLSVSDFESILTATDACLTRQYQAMLAVENVTLQFTADGVRRLAEIAFRVNERTENIGARRLHTVLERLLEQVSYDAPQMSGQTLLVDAALVDERLNGIVQDENLSGYIL